MSHLYFAKILLVSSITEFDCWDLCRTYTFKNLKFGVFSQLYFLFFFFHQKSNIMKTE